MNKKKSIIVLVWIIKCMHICMYKNRLMDMTKAMKELKEIW